MVCSWIVVHIRFLHAENFDPEKTISLSICPLKAEGRKLSSSLLFCILYIIFQGFLFKIPCFLRIYLPTDHIILFYCDMNIGKNNVI